MLSQKLCMQIVTLMGMSFFLLNELIDATSNEDALTLDQQIITVNCVTC